MKENLQIFNYNESPVSFKNVNGTVLINATQMAKPFGKLPHEFLRLPSTNELIKAIARKSLISDNQIVATFKGSFENNGGTWMNSIVAIEFAQWLSIDFKLWCLERLEEIGKYGFTATESKLEEILSNPDLLISLATELKKERQAKAKLELENSELKPKAKFADSVATSESCCLIGELAIILKQNGVNIGQN